MPKVPRGNGKSRSDTARKPPAKRAGAAAEAGHDDQAAAAAAQGRERRSRDGERQAGAGRADPPSPSATSSTAPSTGARRAPAGPEPELTDDQRVLLGDLFAVIEEHAGDAAEQVDRELVEQAFVFACERHADQRRASGEDFIVHPVGVAKICAGMRLDTATLCAALLHDTVEDTSASLEEVEASSATRSRARRRRHQAVRHHVPEPRRPPGRELPQDDGRDGPGHPGHPDQARRPPAQHAHARLDAEAEAAGEGQGDARDLRPAGAPARHPRDQVGARGPRLRDAPPAQVQGDQGARLPAAQEREDYVSRAGDYLEKELEAVGIEAEISGRAKHFYSIYSKMTKKGREFNEIYDLTAMRVIVDSVKDCYGAIGVIHSLWKPLPGRFKDWVAMPKFNMYQALHTTVIGPEGRPLEIQIRTEEMHDTAEYGIAAHWIYKEDGGKPVEEKVEWLKHLLDWQKETQDPQEFAETLKADLFEDEVFVFTPKGEVKSLAGRRHAARLRLRDPHRRRPPLRRRQGQRQDRPAPLRAPVGRHLRGADLEEGARPEPRLALARQDHARAVEDPRLVQARAARGLGAHRPRDPAGEPEARRACRRRRSPARRCSPT